MMEQRKVRWDILRADNLLGEKYRWLLILFIAETPECRSKGGGVWTLSSGCGLTLVIKSVSYEDVHVLMPPWDTSVSFHSSSGPKRSPELWTSLGQPLGAWEWPQEVIYYEGLLLAISVDNKLSCLSCMCVLNIWKVRLGSFKSNLEEIKIICLGV